MSMSTAFSLSKLWNIPWLKHHRKHPDWNGDRDWIPSGIKHGDGEIPHFLEGWILDAPIESSIYGGFPIAMFDRRVNLDLGQQSNSIVSISMASPSLHGTCSIPRCSLFRCEIMYSHWNRHVDMGQERYPQNMRRSFHGCPSAFISNPSDPFSTALEAASSEITTMWCIKHLSFEIWNHQTPQGNGSPSSRMCGQHQLWLALHYQFLASR